MRLGEEGAKHLADLFSDLRPHLLRLYPGLYDDAAPVLDFDVQVVPVQQGHAHQWVNANRSAFDESRLVVSYHRNAVHVEDGLSAIGQDRLSFTTTGSPKSATIVGGKAR